MAIATIEHLFATPTGRAGELRPVLLTELFVPTGHIVACDPLAYFDPQPFEQTCAPGRYPAYVHLLPTADRVAYAELRLSTATVTQWELAVTAGQDVTTLATHEIFGYPVSAGMGCWLDASTIALLDRHDAELQAQLGADYISYYDNCVANIQEAPDAPSPNYGMLRPYPDQENNVVVFQSGYGDGFYATYVGFDAAGQPVKFVTEFIDVAAE